MYLETLLEGKNPAPPVEINYWKACMIDVESVLDKLNEDKAPT